MLRGAGGPAEAHKRLLAYLDWVNVAVQMLAKQISDADLHVLVLTKRHEQLLSGVAIMWGPGREAQRAVIDLVDLEVNQRIEAFETAVKALDAQIRRWSQYSHFVLPDTGFYIKHPQKLEEADFGALIDVWQSPIHILVPMVIIDELDRLKESKDRDVRWRAGYTLAVIDRVFAVTTAPGWLRKGEVSTTDSVPPDVLRFFPPEITTAMAAGGVQRSDVTMELLFDPPGHVRLPINDDKIVDRAVAVESLAGRKVTFLTYDTGQSTRARNAGLQVVKLTKNIGEEPTEEVSQGRRAARRRSGEADQSP
jgi:hypothetical protein